MLADMEAADHDQDFLRLAGRIRALRERDQAFIEAAERIVVNRWNKCLGAMDYDMLDQAYRARREERGKHGEQ